MKKIVSCLLLFSLLLGMCLGLASCAKTVSGTYVNDTTGISYTFQGNKFEKKVPQLIGNGVTLYEGTYEIHEKDNGDVTIVFHYGKDSEEDMDAKDGVELYFAELETNGIYEIKIGMNEYLAMSFIKQ